MKRKKFKDTKLGEFLKDKAPDILDFVGDVLPDKGGLGVVKNMIDRSDMSVEDKMEAEKLLHEQEVELERIYAEDRSSARSREVSWISTFKKRDVMQTATGVAALAAFIFVVVALVYIEVPKTNAEIFYILVGMISTFAGKVFSYYFGSSKGSADKNTLFGKR